VLFVNNLDTHVLIVAN